MAGDGEIRWLQTGVGTSKGFVSIRIPAGVGSVTITGKGIVTGKNRKESVEWDIPTEEAAVETAPLLARFTRADMNAIALASRSARWGA